MATAIRKAGIICAAETLARDTFCSLDASDAGSCDKTISLQKAYRTFTRLATQQFESLNSELNNWRKRVGSGDVDFTSEREDTFKAALHASVSFLTFLIEKFDSHHRDGLFLMNPKRVGLMESHKKEALKILNLWQSPEWETDGAPVHWNKNQTRYLRDRLGSSN